MFALGFLIGLGVGFYVSYLFIFQTDALNLQLAMITIGDILRIIGGVIVTLIGGWIGYLIGAAIDDR